MIEVKANILDIGQMAVVRDLLNNMSLMMHLHGFPKLSCQVGRQNRWGRARGAFFGPITSNMKWPTPRYRKLSHNDRHIQCLKGCSWLCGSSQLALLEGQLQRLRETARLKKTEPEVLTSCNASEIWCHHKNDEMFWWKGAYLGHPRPASMIVCPRRLRNQLTQRECQWPSALRRGLRVA